MSTPKPLGGNRKRIFVVEYRRPFDPPERGWRRRYYVSGAAAQRYFYKRVAEGWHVRAVTVVVAEVRVGRERGGLPW